MIVNHFHHLPTSPLEHSTTPPLHHFNHFNHSTTTPPLLPSVRVQGWSLLQLVPLRGTTIGAETCRGSETKVRVYEAADRESVTIDS